MKNLIIIGLILGIVGIIFSILPHNVHTAIFQQDMNMMDHSSHTTYITYGLVTAVIGFGLAFADWKIFD